MKRRVDPLHLFSGIAFVGVLMVVVGILYRSFQPPQLAYDSLAIRNVTPDRAEVVARTTRRPSYGCTNGIQADLRAAGIVTRLPVPLRAQTSGITSYALVLPSLRPGAYEVKLRESFICRDSFDTVETPWMAMEVEP